VLDVAQGHPGGGPGRVTDIKVISSSLVPPDAERGSVPTLFSVDIALPASVRPLELEALVTHLDYLCARVALDDGRRVICLQVLADDDVGAERYGRRRVAALLSAGDAFDDLAAQSSDRQASRRSPGARGDRPQ